MKGFFYNKYLYIFLSIVVLVGYSFVVFAAPSIGSGGYVPGAELDPDCQPGDTAYDCKVQSGWLLTGNSGTTAGTNFIGTTDDVDFLIKTNNNQIAKLGKDGGITFGSSSLAAGLYTVAGGDRSIAFSTGSFAHGALSVAGGAPLSPYDNGGINYNGTTGELYVMGNATGYTGYIHWHHDTDSETYNSKIASTTYDGGTDSTTITLSNPPSSVDTTVSTIIASGDTANSFATAFGSKNSALGTYSMVWGGGKNGNTASAENSTAWGAVNSATGLLSTVWGDSNNASGGRSTSWGLNNVVSGDVATVFGDSNFARTYGETALGVFGTDSTPAVDGTSINTGDRLFNIGNGTDAGTRSDAFTILKNGKTGIGYDSFEISSASLGSLLQVNGSILSADLAACSNALEADTDGKIICGSGGGGGGAGWALTGNAGTTAGSDFIGTTDAQDFVIKTNSNQMALFGQNGGIALGSSYVPYFSPAPVASGNNSFAIGYETQATGLGSFAGGYGAQATNENSFAFGIFPQATASGAFALGVEALASGNSSMAINEHTTASGQRSFASGDRTVASGVAATAMNDHTTASGAHSFAQGTSTQAFSFTEAAFGGFPTTYSPISQTSFDPADRLFIVGNGDDDLNRSDAFTILKNGKTGIGYDLFESTTHDSLLQVNGSILSADLASCTNPLAADTDGKIICGSGGGGAGWALTGNAGTTAGTNFVGTTDTQDLVFKTNSIQNMRLFNADGSFLIGSGSALTYGGSGEEKKIFFDKTNDLIRLGSVANTNWEGANAGLKSVAIGYAYPLASLQAPIASGALSVALGSGATASGSAAFAVGIGSIASNTNAVALSGATASGVRSFAGSAGTASALGTFAFGSSSSASATSAVAFSGGFATGTRTFAFGTGSLATTTDGVAFSAGQSNGGRSFAAAGGTAGGSDSFAFGSGSVTSNNFSVALSGGTASGNQSFAFGTSSIASGDYSVALRGTASESESIALGTGSVASGNNSVVIGQLNTASGFQSQAFGDNSYATGYRSKTFGSSVVARSFQTTALGANNTDDALSASPLALSPGSRLLVVGNGTGTGTESDALTILNNGQTGIGIDHFEANTNGSMFQVGDGGTSVIGYVDSLTGNWVGVSDARQKHNIADITYGLAQINQLRPVSFDYNRNNAHTIGFLAQDVKNIIPEAVFGSEDTEYGMAYQVLTPALVKAIQELDIKINDIDKQATALMADETFLGMVRNWLGNATNGIQKLFAGEVQTDKLCVGNTCVTETQLQQLLNQQNVQPSQPAQSGGSSEEVAPDPVPPTEESVPEIVPEPDPTPTSEPTPASEEAPVVPTE